MRNEHSRFRWPMPRQYPPPFRRRHSAVHTVSWVIALVFKSICAMINDQWSMLMHNDQSMSDIGFYGGLWIYFTIVDSICWICWRWEKLNASIARQPVNEAGYTFVIMFCKHDIPLRKYSHGNDNRLWRIINRLVLSMFFFFYFERVWVANRSMSARVLQRSSTEKSSETISG